MPDAQSSAPVTWTQEHAAAPGRVVDQTLEPFRIGRIQAPSILMTATAWQFQLGVTRSMQMDRVAGIPPVGGSTRGSRPILNHIGTRSRRSGQRSPIGKAQFQTTGRGLLQGGVSHEPLEPGGGLAMVSVRRREPPRDNATRRQPRLEQYCQSLVHHKYSKKVLRLF